MALTQSQLKANEDYFIKLSKITKMFLWKDYGLMYDIDNNGNYIAHTKRGYQTMLINTPKSFHSKIKRK